MPTRKKATKRKAGSATASLLRYRTKRDFATTPEPRGRKKPGKGSLYLIQKHAARRLHYDLRLELNGVLKSWAVTRGPSLDPRQRRLAVHVEDHPIEYGTFEGTIPKPEYGGGTVMLWDRGVWEPTGDPDRMYAEGRLTFSLQGEKLKGAWHLVRMGGRANAEKRDNWLLIKSRDEWATEPGADDVLRLDQSVKTGRSMAEIEAGVRAPRATAKPRKSAKKAALLRTSDWRTRALPARGLPEFIAPQLATRVDHPPDGPGWVHEIKFDGYRVQARVADGAARLLTRNGHDWTRRFSSLAKAIEAGATSDAIVDGEVVVPGPDGKADFALLQQRLSEGRQDGMVYMAFDLLHFDGRDLRGLPLLERKALLRRAVPASGRLLRISDELSGKGGEVYSQACRIGLEGIVSKRAAGRYVSGRSDGWLKSKCRERQEFVIGGFTDPTRDERGVGSVVLGYWQGGKFIYAGRAGTGFDRRNGPDLRRRLDALLRDTSPFAGIPPAARRGVKFVEPALVCEVEFATWTADRLVRQATFIALRSDKKARTIGIEKIATEAGLDSTRVKSTDDAIRLAGVRLSHPDKVLYKSKRITKLRLAEYYLAVADRILPHVAGRPLSIVRCPDGLGQDCFYQKHLSRGMPDAIRPAVIRDSGGKAEYVSIADADGLIALVQFGALEIHPWNAHVDDVESADQIVIDLDPGPRVPWSKVIDGAKEVKRRLDTVGLESFVKTTGGKGLHVVAPLNPGVDWAVAKEFTRALATMMAADDPRAYVVTSSKAARAGRIFLDYLRNQRGATAVAPYSTRARAGAPVATPLAWSELSTDLRSDAFDVAAIERRHGDSWKGFFKLRQSIDAKTVERLAGTAPPKPARRGARPGNRRS